MPFDPWRVATAREFDILQLGHIPAEKISGSRPGMRIDITVEHQDRRVDRGERRRFDLLGLQTEHVGPGLIVFRGVRGRANR